MSGAARTPVAGAGSIVTFQPGDLLLAASDVDDRNIDLRNHRGPGRILHVGAAFDAKSTLRTGVEGLLVGLAIDPADGSVWGADRSEEHTSELQSLMRISYAVFCLKKKKQQHKSKEKDNKD